MLNLKTVFVILYVHFLNWYVSILVYLKSKFKWCDDLRDRIICKRSIPEYDKWISISYILDTECDFNMFLHDCNFTNLMRRLLYSNYNDSYEFVEDIVPRIQFDKTLSFMEHWRNFSSDIQTRCVHQPLVVVNQDNEHCIVKILHGVSGKNENVFSLDSQLIFFTSKVKFLNVLYSHPNMKEEIHLKIPASMYFIGNQLLSATFVYRMLEHTVGYMFYFDMNYKLKIMDNKMRYFEMGHDEYITLEFNDYKVTKETT